MKAARLHVVGGDFVIEDVPTPEPGPGEVLVRIAAAGACHSDLHARSGEVPITLPQTLGHENAGHVAALGPGAEGQGFAVGDPVLVFGGWGCGRCRRCLSGREQLCGVARWGGMGPDGGYAEHLLVPAVRHLLHADGIDLAEAAPLTDAALTPYAAVQKALPHLVPGSSAVLIGAGGLGQYGIQMLRLLSQSVVIVVDPDPSKREEARLLGADVVIDPREHDAAENIRAATGGDGADAVLDFVGSDATLALGIGALGRGAILVLVGLSGGSVPVGFFSLPSEASITTSSWGSRTDLEEVLALATRGLLRSTVERFPLAEINVAFERLAAGRVAGRAVLIP